VNRRIVIQNEALQDIDDISAYIEEDNPRAALRFRQAAKRTLKRIAGAPGIGAPRDYNNLALTGLRVVLVTGFRSYGVYYLTTPDTVIVLRVLHGARDLDAIFAPR
jgi:toxin ParE1/3/4